MENTLLIGLSRQVTLERQMDVIANNVANVNTNGFKADRSLFHEYLVPTAREDNFAAGRDRRLSHVVDRATFKDFAQGSPDQTKNPLDVAIAGDGFFTVQTPAGERYTRDGAFQINTQGQLVNASGYPVLGTGGPITLQQTDKQVQIANDGTVTVLEGTGRTDSIRGKLRLTTFSQPQRLVKEGSNLFSLGEGNAAQADTKSTVAQGFVERSNVNAVTEMSRMIEINRMYTHMATLLQQQHDLHKSAIDKLAEVPA
jgi:flagellar basal-body rod protein FlgF/flagellar basal-body rod protein FlgG